MLTLYTKFRNVFLLFALTLLPRLGWAQAALADQYRQRAEGLYAQAKYEQAIRWYNRAYQLVRKTDPVRAANLCVDLSSMDYMKGHNRVATNRCLLGQRHLRTVTNPPDSVAFKLFSSLGTFYKAMYQSDSARLCFRAADELLSRNPRIEQQIPLYVLHHYNNQGNWFLKTGNYTRSLSFLTKARRIAEQFGTSEDLTYIESNLAGCYDAMENYPEALKHIIIANKLYHQIDIQKCVFLSGIGWTIYKLNRYPESQHYLAEAELVLKKTHLKNKRVDYILDQIHLWQMMSACYRSASQSVKAERYVIKALQLHQQRIGNQGTLLSKVLIEKGLLYETRHELTLALGAYQAAIRAICRDTTRLPRGWQNPSVEVVFDEPTLLLIGRHKAAVLKKLYDWTQKRTYLRASVDTYQFCVGVQQRIRHGIDADQSQILHTTRHHALVPEAIAAAFDAYQERPTAALRETLCQLFEQARANSLSEALRLSAIRPQTLPPALLEQEQRLKQKIGELRKRPATDTAAQAELTAQRVAWYQLIDSFRQDYPAYYQLNYQDVNLTSVALQQRLDEQTAYLSYVRHGANLFILVATRDRIEIVRQPIDSVRFEQQLTTLRQQLYRDPILARYEGTEKAAELYRALITPVQRYLAGKTRLVIARDWSFTFLPFEVLETGRQARDFLTNRYAIAYAFSAQLFFDRPRQVANNQSVLMVAPFVRAGAVTEAVNRQGNRQPLASSEAEARSIGGELLLGPDASLSRFLKTDLARPVVYFATHAQTDDTDPANSCIAFYPGRADKLYTDDIYNLSLSATGLVVLGACETGSGKTMQGEGVLSLARAFAYAGCPSVVTTLWKANDETTSFLTIRLHHYLTRGLPTDRALQRARQDFFDSPLFAKYDHPYYWANYTLLGNHNPVMPGGHPPGLAWLLTAVGAIGFLAFWQRNRLTRFVKQQSLPVP